MKIINIFEKLISIQAKNNGKILYEFLWEGFFGKVKILKFQFILKNEINSQTSLYFISETKFQGMIWLGEIIFVTFYCFLSIFTLLVS